MKGWFIMEKKLYLDIHVLQTVPASCINRDDTGSPKTAVYGGAVRARVSSQAWKHAMREFFKQEFPDDKLAKRTKRIVALVAEEIGKMDSEADRDVLAQKVVEAFGVKIKQGKKGEENAEKLSEALFFMSAAQAKALAEFALHNREDICKEKLSLSKEQTAALRNAVTAAPGIDIALFGRMVADDPSLNNDACAQVAHSISTHRVSTEFDYFTAVDDLAPEDNAGAAHIGTVEFNSSTLYRYATVAVHQLHKQLGDDTAAALRGTVEAFVCSMPTGRQNTFANRTLPDLVLVTLRKDQPVNLAGAFERPIPASDEGYLKPSAEALIQRLHTVESDYLGAPLFAAGIGGALKDTVRTMPLRALLDEITNYIAAHREEL